MTESYVVLAQIKTGEPDTCEWTVFDGRDALSVANRYAERLRDRGFRFVQVRSTGPIVTRLHT